MLNKLVSYFFLAILLLYPGTVTYADSDSPTQVLVGTYVQNIVDLNLRTNNVSVDFYLWFRWKGDKVAPHETFEIVNGKINSRNVLETRLKPEENFSQVRVNATLYVNWNLHKFSLDRQVIPITVEDSALDATRLIYIPDTPNISVRQSIEIPGYQIVGQRSLAAENSYLTNFGDPTLPSHNRSVYSQYIQQIEIHRPDYGYFFKLFGSMILATLLAPFGFALKAEKVDSRIGIGVGAIFGVSGNNFAISGQLPPTSVITLADQMFFLSITVVVFCLFLAVINWKLNCDNNKELLAKKLDRLGLAIPLLYIPIVLSFVLV